MPPPLAPAGTVGDADTKDWVVSQYLLVTAFSHLDGDAQAQVLIDLPEHGPPLVQLDSVFQPASAAMVDTLVDRAIASTEEHRLLMALAFVRGSGSPISPEILARVRELTGHTEGAVRGLALQISAEHPDDAQLADFVASGWSAVNHDPREHFYERWHGSSMIIAAGERGAGWCRSDRAHQPERYGRAAEKLGGCGRRQAALPPEPDRERATARVLGASCRSGAPCVFRSVTMSPETMSHGSRSRRRRRSVARSAVRAHQRKRRSLRRAPEGRVGPVPGV